jgi:hypothetical protein
MGPHSGSPAIGNWRRFAFEMPWSWHRHLHPGGSTYAIVNPSTIGETDLPMSPGLAVPVGDSLRAETVGSIAAEVWVSGYTVPASAVPAEAPGNQSPTVAQLSFSKARARIRLESPWSMTLASPRNCARSGTAMVTTGLALPPTQI